MTEQVLYFHGIPGGIDELELFGGGLATASCKIDAIDRAYILSGTDEKLYFETLSAAITEQFPGVPLRFVGFSLGASAALRVAALLGQQVSQIDLVSAAAPLSLGDHLGGMAGAPIFRLAQSSPALFAMLARLQSAFARFAPGQLYNALFASAQGDDLALSKDPVFKAAMLLILQQSLGPGLGSYRREILAYVQDWAEELDEVTQPVTLYHGRADNWSPVAMTQGLAERLPQVAAVHLFDDLSHYSTLRKYWRCYFTQPSPIVS